MLYINEETLNEINEVLSGDLSHSLLSVDTGTPVLSTDSSELVVSSLVVIKEAFPPEEEVGLDELIEFLTEFPLTLTVEDDMFLVEFPGLDVQLPAGDEYEEEVELDEFGEPVDDFGDYDEDE